VTLSLLSCTDPPARMQAPRTLTGSMRTRRTSLLPGPLVDSPLGAGRLYLKRGICPTHHHLVCGLHACPDGFSAWLRIAHCCIPVIFTVPEAINLATPPFRAPLGRLSFRVSPQFDGVARDIRTSWRFRAAFFSQLSKEKLRRKPANR
jgi:hypothetical protein